MYELITAAIAQKDYRQAAELIQKWQKASPKDPMMLLSIAKLQEASLQWDAAEKTYLKFLKQVNNPKLMSQAREGLKRIQQEREASRQAALEQAHATSDSQEPGLLLLEPSPAHDRAEQVQALADVFQMDPYVARMQLPARGLRLQRLGPIGELQFYGEALQQKGIAAFWVKANDIKAVQTFQVQYFEQLSPVPVVVCKSPSGQLGKIQFEWAEVVQQVLGQLPIFEEVADIGLWGKPVRKEQTQDYVQIIDLHFSQRKIILRICDRTYQFSQSAHLLNPPTNGKRTIKPLSTREQWNRLLESQQPHLTGPKHNGFKPFGQGALEFIDLLPYLNPYLDIDRRRPSHWDTAFHLYSTVLFLKSQSSTP
jgi:hypothetical protein